VIPAAFALALIIGCTIPLRRIWRNRKDGFDYWNWLQG
jgi:hypothetical protein